MDEVCLDGNEKAGSQTSSWSGTFWAPLTKNYIFWILYKFHIFRIKKALLRFFRLYNGNFCRKYRIKNWQNVTFFPRLKNIDPGLLVCFSYLTMWNLSQFMIYFCLGGPCVVVFVKFYKASFGSLIFQPQGNKTILNFETIRILQLICVIFKNSTNLSVYCVIYYANQTKHTNMIWGKPQDCSF
jgi:hypothetical protein